jgi:quinol monooxygenase YgiN
LTTNCKFDKMKRIILLLITATIMIACSKNDRDDNNLIVLVKYKAQPGKSAEAVTGLKNLIEKVKGEEYFVGIRLHIDKEDNSNILLYEEWSDEIYYQNDHMKTEHLKKFMIDSREFLAGPPEITFWKLNQQY